MSVDTRERVTGPCTRCERRTWAADRVCRACRRAEWFARQEPDALTGGEWQPRGLVQVWVEG